MVDCDKAITLLSDYIDGSLEPDTRKAIDKLLEENQECKRIYTNAIMLHQKVQRLEPLTASNEFDQNLRQRIQALSAQDSKTALVNKRGISYIFSGAMLVIAVYFMMFTNFGTDVDQQTGDIQPSSTISAPVTTKMLPTSQKSMTLSNTDPVKKDSVAHSPVNPTSKKSIKLVGEGN